MGRTSEVYIKDEKLMWIPATLKKTEGTKAYVTVPKYPNEQAIMSDGGRGAKKSEERVINLKDYHHKVLPLQNVDKNGVLAEHADMVELPYLHEAAILYNMKKRHIEGKPYTRAGDIIIAINPFQWFNHLYTEEKRSLYSNKLVWSTGDKDARSQLEPHVYEVSALSYKGLAFERQDQSILVSGESGAGKTETVKIAMNHIASVQKGPSSRSSSGQLDPVVQRVVESNPLLEAFGNAKTRRNDNSSRFGKYLQLQFDSSEASLMAYGKPTESKCKLAGSKCDVYLLEKNRIVGHDELERTFHIFYQILAAPDSEKIGIWENLRGTNYSSFKYVGASKTNTIEGMSDAQHFDATVKTLELINIKGDRLRELMRAICAVMQCGNLMFGPLKGDSDKSEITSKDEVSKLAGLMGVKVEDLSQAFTLRTMKTPSETYQVPLNTVFAKDACDALAKEMYGNIFLWLVREINEATCAEKNYGNKAIKNFGIIGLLDIFGFESFTVNRFEQLCINYANEKLQQKFTEDIFRSVQEEYESEGIALAEITYDDNSDVLDLIESRTGLLALLNEECVRPKGNDQDFVHKALQQNKVSPCLLINKTDRMSFGIHHYAGKVFYDAEGFVGSNQDTLPTDLSDLCVKSTNRIISEKIKEEVTNAETNSRNVSPKRQKSNIVAPTVWGKYKTQLITLMTNLRKTNSRYIRCIKPNMAKKPVLMEHEPTVEQLRCAGVVAAVTLSRAAFPNRINNAVVRFRFSSAWDNKSSPSKANNSMSLDQRVREDCIAILDQALKSKEDVNSKGQVKKAFVVGKTRTYFRAGALEYLEANRLENGLDEPATKIQALARGFLVKMNLGNVREESEQKRMKEEEEKKKKKEADEAKRAEENARRLQFKKKQDELKAKIAEIKSLMDEEDTAAEAALKAARKQSKKTDKEIEDLKAEHTGVVASQLQKQMAEKGRQEKKIEQAVKLIGMLKKENKKIQKQYDKVRGKLEGEEHTAQKVEDMNSSLSSMCDSVGSKAEKVGAKQYTLMEEYENLKEKQDHEEKHQEAARNVHGCCTIPP
jgi:myosin-5